jgi:nicotinate phosphoribosyltransferase
VHASEPDAFAAQVSALGTGTTLLVDTYEEEQAIRTAVEVAGSRLGV